VNSRDFAYWIQGYFEIERARAGGADIILNNSQVECIQKHLAMVFVHEIDPSFGKSNPALDALHRDKQKQEIDELKAELKKANAAHQSTFTPSNPVMRC
jgi:hypothetical protein